MYYLIISLILISMNSCCVYKMPTDDYVATNPVVNNPQLINEKPQAMPGR